MVEENRCEIIANDQEIELLLPMLLLLIYRLVGDGAKNQSSMNPQNTVFDAKRLIGRKFDDPVLKNDVLQFPFSVVDDGNNKPVIEVQYKNEMKRFHPEISSAVLTKMKE